MGLDGKSKLRMLMNDTKGIWVQKLSYHKLGTSGYSCMNFETGLNPSVRRVLMDRPLLNLILGTLLLVSVLNAQEANEDQPVVFDPELIVAINYQLASDDGTLLVLADDGRVRRRTLDELMDPITIRRMHRLESLNASRLVRGNRFRGRNTPSMLDLSGLEHAVNLKQLYLSGNMEIDPESGESVITANLHNPDFGFISKLQMLEVLRLGANEIEEWNVPQGLTRLHTIDLSGNRLREFEFHSESSIFTTLSLEGNALERVTLGGDLRRFRSLSASENSLTEIEFLSPVPGLEVMRLAHNQLEVLRIPGEASQLEELDLSNNRLLDLTFEQGASQRSDSFTLNLAANGLTQLPQSLPRVNHLILDDNELETFSPSGSARFEIVSIKRNLLKEVKMPDGTLGVSLRSLDLEGNRIEALFFEGPYPRLTLITANGNPLSNVRLHSTQVESLLVHTIHAPFLDDISIQVSDDGTIRLQFVASPGNYNIQRSKNLINWTTIGELDLRDSGSGIWEFIDQSDDASTMSFYRIYEAM
jgi:Leucine-rich repeat (LRR) protein